MSPEEAALILVVSGPGGVGKGTVVRRLLEVDPGLWLSRSWTTRPRRPGEPEDAYEFVDREHFEERRDAGGFLEWTEFLGHLYGTPEPAPPPGKDVVLEIEVDGARQVKARHPDALLVVVDTPSRDEQAARLRGRGDPEERVQERLAKASEELAAASELGAIPIINDDLDRAVEELRGLIQRVRSTRS